MLLKVLSYDYYLLNKTILKIYLHYLLKSNSGGKNSSEKLLVLHNFCQVGGGQVTVQQ